MMLMTTTTTTTPAMRATAPATRALSARRATMTTGASAPIVAHRRRCCATTTTARVTTRRASRTTTHALFNSSNESQGKDGGATAATRVSTDAVMIDPVVGAKRFSNYFWAGVVTAGSTGFLLTGASAYLHHNLVFFLDASEIKFFPQGLVMSFYGVAGALLSTYLWLTISWDVGAGYNEFNKEEGIMRIFRYGFPGKNRRINLVSDLADVQAVRVEISEGVNPRRVVYVRCKGKRDIPLTRIGQPLTLAEVESRAAELAKFLQVPIEGL